MLEFIKTLLSLNVSLAGRAKGATLYNEAMALCEDKRYRDALPLLRQAGELGNADAMAQLGAMHMLGQGTQENNREAVPWLEMAIRAGHKTAVGTLGMLLATGKGGVPRDMGRAVSLMKQAAAEGDSQSARMLEMIDKGEGMFAASKKRKS
ncbi:sel1 repeat family protein [Nitrospirales bacterium NOB]|nr:sel1 repeat family protein [Nitrospirales bacterium NOB]